VKRILTGIVMEVDDKSATIMTNDGEFLNVKKTSPNIMLGEEITSTEIVNSSFKLYRYAAMAAVILLMLVPFIYFREAYATVAYINVDINPSIELAVNRFNRVNKVIPLNWDGEELVKKDSLKGLDVNDSIKKIIASATDMGYISEDKYNNIEITIVKLKDKNVGISSEILVETAKSALLNADMEATIEIHKADKKVHDEAKKENLSTNKYLDKKYNGSDSIKVDVKKDTSSIYKEDKNTKDKDEKSNGATGTSPAKNNGDGKKDKDSNQDKKNDATGKGSSKMDNPPIDDDENIENRDNGSNKDDNYKDAQNKKGVTPPWHNDNGKNN